MTPLGKICLALIGFKIWGLDGLLWGLFIGHTLIDKTRLNESIKDRLGLWDSALRLLLPYRFYNIYDRFLDIFSNKYSQKIKHILNFFFDRNLFKILGATIGFTLNSKILIFSGIIIGFFADRHNLNKGLKNQSPIKFWRKINPLKLALTSKEAKQVAFIQSLAVLSAKICKSDGKISENEINTFKKLFNIEEEQNTFIANIFFEAQNNKEGVERHANQIRLITKDNLELKENFIENLFKIATADGYVTDEKVDILKNIAIIIQLPIGNFEAIRGSFKNKPCSINTQDFYSILGINCNAGDDEIKKRWKELLSQYHPDKVQANGGSVDEIRFASEKMAEINNAYQSIMKNRKI